MNPVLNPKSLLAVRQCDASSTFPGGAGHAMKHVFVSQQKSQQTVSSLPLTVSWWRNFEGNQFVSKRAGFDSSILRLYDPLKN